MYATRPVINDVSEQIIIIKAQHPLSSLSLAPYHSPHHSSPPLPITGQFKEFLLPQTRQTHPLQIPVNLIHPCKARSPRCTPGRFECLGKSLSDRGVVGKPEYMSSKSKS